MHRASKQVHVHVALPSNDGSPHNNQPRSYRPPAFFDCMKKSGASDKKLGIRHDVSLLALFILVSYPDHIFSPARGTSERPGTRLSLYMNVRIYT